MSHKIKVVVKAFEVLEILSKESKLSLKEITEKVAYSKSTVFRLLYTLQSLGYLEQDLDAKTFTLSSKFISFIDGANRGSDLLLVAKPYLENLLEEFKETVNLAKLVDNSAVYINVLESPHSFRISDHVGDHAPFHSTAIGKAIIAFLPEEKRKKILKDYSFTRFTKKTITNISEFEKELEKIKKQGFAIDDEEGHEGVICVSAPIFNKEHESFAAISVSMPKVRTKKLILNRLIKKLPQITQKISISLSTPVV